MNSITPTVLRCILAIALVMGGLPAWGVSATAAQYGTAVMQDASDGAKFDCQAAKAELQHDAESGEPAHDCCEKGTACEHESCRCVCPATSPVVPFPPTSAALLARSLPPSVLNAPAPRDVINTLLRPPRA